MSIIKSYSFPVGEIRGNMFYIKHDSSNFTVIDCYLKDGDDASCRKKEIIKEIVSESNGRICRFISTHPDKDHILGIEELDKEWKILNFYAVGNSISSNSDDLSLQKYLQLKKDKNYPIKAGIKRKWLNEGNDELGGSGINFHWPILSNEKFKEALRNIDKKSNDICCIFTYSIKNGAKYMWMGDLETEMQSEYYRVCKNNIPNVDILFQPHHGRESGSVPRELLEALAPKLIIIGNAPAEHIDYGDSQQTITHNTAGDIMFENENGEVHVYTKNKITNVPTCLTNKKGKMDIPVFKQNGKIKDVYMYYCGTLSL